MKIYILIIMILSAQFAISANLYVDYNSKNKIINGAKATPFRNFSSAFNKAKAGDTICILPSETPIIDSILIRNKNGIKDKPIIVDGSFNIFLGVAPIDQKIWSKKADNLYTKTIELTPNLIMRYFMVFDGKMQRMGRILKGGVSKNYKKVEELKDGEWTIIDSEPKNLKKHKYTFYFKLPQNLSLSDVSEPIKQISGVNIAGNIANYEIKNVIIKHFWNDGFNIHGNVKNVTFKNICAIECSDDGLSAHGNCEIIVENYISIGNVTGICHVQNAKSTNKNIHIEKSIGFDIFFLNKVKNSFDNLNIISDSLQGIVIKNTDGYFKVANSNFIKNSKRAYFVIGNASNSTFTNSSFANFISPNKAGLINEDTSTLMSKIKKNRQKLFDIFQGKLQ